MNTLANSSTEVNPREGPDIEAAIAWLRATINTARVEPHQSLIPTLRARFRLNAVEAVRAIQLARKAVRS